MDKPADIAPWPPRPKLRRPGAGLWAGFALLLAALLLLPALSVLRLALSAEGVWPAALPRYVAETLRLMLGTGALSLLFGLGPAWLLTFYRVPLAPLWRVALVLPLAVPSYLAAYLLADLLDYAGPLQSAWRAAWGLPPGAAPWPFSLRSPGGAMLILAAGLSPYVYLLARTAFQTGAARFLESGRLLGAGPWRLFWRLGLPLARPALVAGTALVMMEVLADYGTMAQLNVQTLTTGIFTTWLTGGDAGGAARLAGLILLFVLALVAAERAGRRHLRHSAPVRGGAGAALRPARLSPPAALAALILCALPVVLGFLLPLAALLRQLYLSGGAGFDAGLWAALAHSLQIGGAAAALTLSAALLLVFAARLARGQGLLPRLLPLTFIGYAAPGAVLALGLLGPLAAFDHALADGILRLSGAEIGLWLTGSAGAVILACSLRFFGIAQGAVEAGFARLPPAWGEAAQALGASPRAALWRLYLPLLRRSLFLGAILVFVDGVKELPATLLLRPFNYETLATRAFEAAEREALSAAAPAALIIIATGLVAALLLLKASAPRQG